jgi:hypothetical protein
MLAGAMGEWKQRECERILEQLETSTIHAHTHTLIREHKWQRSERTSKFKIALNHPPRHVELGEGSRSPVHSIPSRYVKHWIQRIKNLWDIIHAWDYYHKDVM